MTAPTFAAWWAHFHGVSEDKREIAEAAWTARGEALRPWLEHKPTCHRMNQTECSHPAANCTVCTCGLSDLLAERSAG